MRAIVRDDAAKGVPGGLAWHGKLEGGKGRKVVKRGVMTTPYGVTERGIKMQLIKDKRLEDITGDGDLAGYITDHIVTAIETVVASSKDVKAWLQTVAASLSKAGMPFEWKTPTGSTVRQAYRVQTVDRVRTLCGRVNLNKEVQNGALTDKKQALGSSPNFIHSFDASHLALTVNEAVAEGVRSFAPDPRQLRRPRGQHGHPRERPPEHLREHLSGGLAGEDGRLHRRLRFPRRAAPGAGEGTLRPRGGPAEPVLLLVEVWWSGALTIFETTIGRTG